MPGMYKDVTCAETNPPAGREHMGRAMPLMRTLLSSMFCVRSGYGHTGFISPRGSGLLFTVEKCETQEAKPTGLIKAIVLNS